MPDVFGRQQPGKVLIELLGAVEHGHVFGAAAVVAHLLGVERLDHQPVTGLEPLRQTAVRGQIAGFLQAHRRHIDRGDVVALLCQPDPVAALAVARQQHATAGLQARCLLPHKGIGLGAIFEAGLGKALIPKIHGAVVSVSQWRSENFKCRHAGRLA